MDTEGIATTDGAPSSAREARRQAKIRQITRAATNVFLEYGFAAASIDRIVEKASVSKRTLYNYYDSKEEIFIDVMQMRLGSIYEKFNPGRDRGGDLRQQLGQVGIEFLRIVNSPETLALFRNVIAESQRFPKLARQFFRESFAKVIDGIAAILEREAGNSGLRDTDAKEAAEYFLDLLTGTAYQRVLFGVIPPMDDKARSERTEWALSCFYRMYQRHG